MEETGTVRCSSCGAQVDQAISVAWREERDFLCSGCINDLPGFIGERLSSIDRGLALTGRGKPHPYSGPPRRYPRVPRLNPVFLPPAAA